MSQALEVLFGKDVVISRQFKSHDECWQAARYYGSLLASGRMNCVEVPSMGAVFCHLGDWTVRVSEVSHA